VATVALADIDSPDRERAQRVAVRKAANSGAIAKLMMVESSLNWTP
jgi:hypothetical protein